MSLDIHLMIPERFIRDDVIETVCGAKGNGTLRAVGIPARVTCPACLKVIEHQREMARRVANRLTDHPQMLSDEASLTSPVAEDPPWEN